jgi:uncharacterized membrane protein YjgN (DUF898 family)
MQPPQGPYNQAPLPNPYGDPMPPLGGGNSNRPSPFNATLILVLGILGIVCCGFLAPVSWIMSNNALALINSGQANESDRSTINIARILGIIGTVLVVLGLIFYVVILVFGTIAGTFSGGRV